MTNSRSVAVVTALFFALIALNGCVEPETDNDDPGPQPSVEITEYPGHDSDEAPIVIPGEEWEMAFEVHDCPEEECFTECQINQSGYLDCTSPYTFELLDEHRGEYFYNIRLFKNAAIVASDQVIADVRMGFDFGLEDMEQDSTTDVVSPFDVEPYCFQANCELSCELAGEEVECEDAQTLTLEFPDEAEEATLVMGACTVDSDDDFCMPDREFHFRLFQ